jgi:DNA-binding NarL/FixJ family response regulator
MPQIREARASFDALAFADLAETARSELRASGEASRRRTDEAWDQLTPQELQIGRAAAAGLSNREIGEQLYISHRTVGYHMHRIFAKLGITSVSRGSTFMRSDLCENTHEIRAHDFLGVVLIEAS